MTERNRALVRYIWFCLELSAYDCVTCVPGPFPPESAMNSPMTLITISFQTLFSALSTWDPHGDLVLDISVYSPDDSEHWFKYLTFMPDTPSDMLDECAVEKATSNRQYHDPLHGWVSGLRQSDPPIWAFLRMFDNAMDTWDDRWWDRLPSVTAVTSLLLRQQNRRGWRLRLQARMFARLPRLQEVHYEPWREWCAQSLADKGKHCCAALVHFQGIARSGFRRQSLSNRDPWLEYEFLFKSIRRSNKSLKRLVIFENFNQQYSATMIPSLPCKRIRNPNPAVARAVARASLELEHVAASYIADASHFFDMDPAWERPNLTSLVLTSKLLTPDGDPVETGVMLRAAAAAAVKMPRLETMEIWNGRKGLAALFRYQALHDKREAVVVWRGTWMLAMEPSTIQAWGAVMQQYDGWRLGLVEELVDRSAVKSHGDSIRFLELSGQVIRPISLQQILVEQKALEGVETLE
ncbi:PRANC domain protein [Colletotrichum sojae]|uniref:PRANC domain protein n=1 Tax=Colletotrichum sojae TaxID=2175907 RepID=A0A8H6J2S2_9PEZI|nr:PRANC domain protein [Colletotrichum sojae]